MLALLLAVVPSVAAGQPIPRPEHPRPDFQRQSWLNLNGPWQFEIDAKGDGEQRGLTTGHDLSGRILVPFCPESRLSGVGHTDFVKDVWYRRSVGIPKEWAGKRLLLHFGAVDWHARVWVNGTFVGEHRGGYTPFTLEMTEAARPGANEIVVHASDDTRSGMQATGKQCPERDSFGCFYTRTTGIWQTVWIEAVGDVYLRSFSLTPDPDGGRVLFRGWVDGPANGTRVRVRAYAGRDIVADEMVPAAWRGTAAALKLKQVRPWFPGRPFLYDVRIDVLRDGKPTDTVRSYFGLRKVSIEGNRFLVNGKPVFQRLVLDQGFYPDGIYTAPSDEALRRDIELAMAAGFNGARLHQKVFEPRLLYWADRLGYLVWGEYPSWGLNLSNQVALSYAVAEWKEAVERDRGHPAIIGWCPLNETGSGEAVAAAQALFAVTRLLDETRPYLDSSGYVHLEPRTDVYDCHDYDQNPASFAARYAPFGLTGRDPWNNNLSDPRSRYRGQPFFVSEYGGIHLRTQRATGDDAWGYGQADLKEFLARYRGLTDALLDNPNMFGFCYTQLTDVEQEQNGIYYYDRTPKYDVALVRAINARAAAYETQGPRLLDIAWRTVMATSRESPQTWRYTLEEPAAGWFRPGFDDMGWQSGPGGFGTKGTPGSVVGTPWSGPDIWLRRNFTLPDTQFEYAALDIHHDEDAEVYVNGERIIALSGYSNGYGAAEATRALRGALRAGDNTIAVHCRQTTGGQFIDVGIVFGASAKATR
ncbi:MAG: beta-galactosidase [Chthonomonadales bacterium]|nr:beta-galactosidase [Chthonomonadales bacterium]